MRSHLIRFFVFALTLTFIVGYAPTTYAFKVDAHIWIADRVLNDARDGSLTVLLGGKRTSLKLNARYAAALRAHPKAFLVGSLGPDAFPDVVAGQMVIHPSTPGGWGTAEWLKHLLLDTSLSGEELAFTLGYLTHAASDVFAHTYVNRYAGDLFELVEHEWAAVRHINIESFISNYLPATSGGIVPSELVRPGDKVEVPEDLLLRKFLLNPEAVEQYRKSGNAPHLVAAYDLHKSLVDFTAEDGTLFDLEALGLKLTIEAVSGIPIARKQAEELQKIHNRVTSELNNFAGDIAVYAKDLNEELGRIEGIRNELVAKGMTEAVSLADKLADVQLKLARELINLQELLNDLTGIPQTIAKNVCREIAKWFGLEKLCEVVDIANPIYVAKKAAIEVSRDLIDSLSKRKDELTKTTKEAIQEGLDVIQEALQIRIALTNSFIDLMANKPFSSDFRRPFEIWRDNIPVALVQYSKANAQAIVNSIDPAKPSILEPLKRWFICYGPAIIAPIPVQISDGVCGVWDGIDKVKKELDEFEAKLAELTPLTEAIFEAKKKLEEKLSELKEKVYGVVITTGLKQFDAIANTNTLELYKALTQPVGVAEVNDVMSRDDTNQGLPIIADAAQRILTELSLKDGKLDPDVFSPVYDAVVLSKLAMLDNPGLVKLSRDAGVTQSLFGPYLYKDGGDVVENVLFGFVQNIDGNHHWHDLAPPHPRTFGYDDVDFQERIASVDKRYGYADKACPRVLGMRMWVDPTARESLFYKLFKGRIAFGVDVPAELGGGYTTVLHPSYPDLINGTDWSEDGITLAPAATGVLVSYDLSLSTPRDGTVEILVDGQLQNTIPAVAGGTASYRLTIDQGTTPVRLTLVTKSLTGRVISSFSTFIGCDGADEGEIVQSAVTVVKGDSLWRISEMSVGDGSRWPELFEANRDQIKNPHRIYPGQVLTLPWAPTITLAKV